MPSKTTAKKAKKTVRKRTSRAIKYVYSFGKKTDGNAKMKELLGGKGANLAEMAAIGLPVPGGFTITTEVCTAYYDNGRKYPTELKSQVEKAIKTVERECGKKFGEPKNPLLFSVRSGARESMPGMMDTILNLGLNDKTVAGLAKLTGNGRFAYDCYRRFIQMYGDVVMGVQSRNELEPEPFEQVLEEVKKEVGVEIDSDLTEENNKEVIRRFQKLIKDRTGGEFPQDVHKQLDGAVGAVFNSWQRGSSTVGL